MAKKKTYTITLTLPDGSRKYFRGSTKKEAEQKRDAAKFQLHQGIDLSCETTVAELTETWFKLYKLDNKDLHIRSIQTTRGILDRQLLPILGQLKVIDVKPIHIQQLMTSISEYSESTQKKVLQAARAIFSVAVENGMIAKSPISEKTKAGGAKPAEKKPLTKSQSEALLQAVKGTRAYLLVLVLLYGGLRIGEALGMMWKDIDFDEGTLSVERSIVYPKNQGGEINEDLKTENAHRTVPLPWAVIEELKAARAKSNSVWVFAMQDGQFLTYSSFRALWRIIDYRTVDKVVRDQRELVKRTLNFHVHPHLLRHTCITRWFEQGLDVKEVQYLAGHATVDITLNIYTHFMADQRLVDTAKKIRAAV